MNKINICIVGVTGLVGTTFLKVLEEKNLPINNIYFFASKKSAGKKIIFKDKTYEIQELTENSFDTQIDFALFSAGSNVSLKYAPIAKEKGVIVIDNSSAFRMCDDVPLVVPEVNAHILKNYKGIIANPNCSTIQAVVALKPLDDKYGIKRIVYSTYQAVSGAGVEGINDLVNTQKGLSPSKFSYAIANNCIPQIDVFDENGNTFEEIKMINETRKILENENIKISATAVRVPVLNSHSESINVEFNNPFKLDEVLEILKNAPSIVLLNDNDNNIYPLATIATGTDDVYVGRVRVDNSVQYGLNMFVVADNIRKGAASNAIGIMEAIICQD